MEPTILSPTLAETMFSKGFIFIDLGSTPNDEECTQAGEDLEAQIMECRAFINHMRRIHGPEPEGAKFYILEYAHPSGIYYHAAIGYTPPKEQSDILTENLTELYVLKCEMGLEEWDEIALYELRAAGHPNFQHIKIDHEDI